MTGYREGISGGRATQGDLVSRNQLLLCFLVLVWANWLFTVLGSAAEIDVDSALPAVKTLEATAQGREGSQTQAGIEKQKVRADLDAIWAGYQSEIVSAEIDYLFLTWTQKSPKLSVDDFFRELEGVSLVADETLTQRLVEKFCPESLGGTEEQNLKTLKAIGDWRTYRQQGGERRCLSEVFEHVVSDDLHLLVDHPNRGVRAYRRGDCKYFYETMDWFRFLPNDALLADSTISLVEPDLYRLEFYGPAPAGATKTAASWMLLGRDDGLPRELQMVSPLKGEVLRMERFQDLTLYPGEVLCPAVRVKIHVAQGSVTTVRMTVIQRAQFNQPLEEDAFVLSTPANWSWFDWQLERHAGGQWKQPVTDAARFFRERTVAIAPAEGGVSGSGPVRSWRSLLLVLNGVILVVIGIALWRRSS